MVVPATAAKPSVTLTLLVEFSSHCISRGPKKDCSIDFCELGIERLVIDHRQIRRAFHQERHALSFLLPDIVASLAERRCFFTGHENFLTLELGDLMPGLGVDARYEIYFSVRKAEAKNTLKVFIESAYVRDEEADNQPVNFKKADKITGWKVFLNKARGSPVNAARNSALKIRR